MVAFLLFHILRENENKPLRRDRVFSDRSQVLDTFTDEELFGRHRFPLYVTPQLTDEVKDFIQPKTLRSHSIIAYIQVIWWI